MNWVFGDGTVLQQAGAAAQVIGATVLAGRLRHDLELLGTDMRPYVWLHPRPSTGLPLDPSNPQHIDTWCRDHAASLQVVVVNAPEIDYPQADSEPGAVY